MENTLQHHGILGMKWGVRRYQNKDGTLTDAGRSRYADSGDSSDSNSSSTSSGNNSKASQSSVRTSRTSNMTDDELKAVVKRLQMEKQYKDLMKELTATQKSAGKKFVESVLNDAGKQVATEYTKKAMSAGMNKLIKELTGSQKTSTKYNLLEDKHK